MTPTARTLAWLRSQGYQAEVVERFNSFSKTRHDLFGWIDIVTLSPGTVGTIGGVQCTSGANHAARVEKVREMSLAWKRAGGGVAVVSWAKRGPRGKRKVWTVRVEAL